MIEGRCMEPKYNLNELLKLPKNTLGYTYAKIMTLKGFQPYFYRDRPSIDDESHYIIMRTCKTHDLYDTVNGFNMSIGEIGTIATNVAQYGYPAYMLVELVALISACFPGLAHMSLK